MFHLLRYRRFGRGFQEFGESVELALPELTVFVDPRLRVPHGRGAKVHAMYTAILFATDQLRALEDFKVLRDRWPGHLEWGRQIANGSRPFCEPTENCAARGIGQGGEGGVESNRHNINQLVKCN